MNESPGYSDPILLHTSSGKGFSKRLKLSTQKWSPSHKAQVSANACAKCLPVCGSQYFYTAVLFLDLRRFQWLQSSGRGRSEVGPSKQYLGWRQEWTESNTGAAQPLCLRRHGIMFRWCEPGLSLSISTEEVTVDCHSTEYKLIDN